MDVGKIHHLLIQEFVNFPYGYSFLVSSFTLAKVVKNLHLGQYQVELNNYEIKDQTAENVYYYNFLGQPMVYSLLYSVLFYFNRMRNN